MSFLYVSKFIPAEKFVLDSMGAVKAALREAACDLSFVAAQYKFTSGKMKIMRFDGEMLLRAHGLDGYDLFVEMSPHEETP